MADWTVLTNFLLNIQEYGGSNFEWQLWQMRLNQNSLSSRQFSPSVRIDCSRTLI